MATNKLALIRYKVIDNCLKNNYRKWTLEDIMDSVSDALYEYEGIESGVSKRTIQQDIQIMRSDKIGYNAPIEVYDKKYYKYSDKHYSITNLPITSNDLEKMNEAVLMLKQFSGFNYFDDLGEVITKLESKVHSSKNIGKSYVQFEKNELLKGLKYIEPIHKAIIEKKGILVEYKSFRAKNSSQFILIPYLLKEYRNRWFVLGVNKKRPNTFLISALDRIQDIEILSIDQYIEIDYKIVSNYFENVIGVTKSLNQRPNKIILKIDNENSPYVITKPFHKSQVVLKKEDDGVTIKLEVVWNFELEREILGFGENIEVVSPAKLRRKIYNRISKASNNYSDEED